MIIMYNQKGFEKCNLCARDCGAFRSQGTPGFCGETSIIRVARAGLHMWEEPCISGTRGSGTVFFSGCSLQCVFCQNHEISSENIGFEIGLEQLSDVFLRLESKGANNINLVTPGHFVPQVITAIELARKKGLKLPFVYNTGSYEKVETIAMLDGYIDVYLPDLKFLDPVLGKQFASAPDYFEVASRAIEEMLRQTGIQVFYPESEDTEGQMLIGKGVIVRHLVLPLHTHDSKRIVEYLYRTYGDTICISLMNQFTPVRQCEYPELNRKLTEREYASVVDYALSIGVKNAYIQEGGTVKTSFIPAFDGTGI